MVCKYFLPFCKLPFHSVDCFLFCLEAFWFDALLFVCFCFFSLCFWSHDQKIMSRTNVKKLCGLFSSTSLRIARGDNKGFLSNQCKEIEENNKMGKTRDLFKKIRDTKGTFHSKMCSIKDRNGMDLIEAEDIKKRWQEYTEELCKKIFTIQIIMKVWSLTLT